MIRTRHLPEAVKAWGDLRRRGLLPGPAAGPELLHNPDLGAPILGGGFDWRIEPVAHVGVSLGPGRRGERPPAVVIRFSGEVNLHYRGFYQYAVVEPNRRYRFQAWLRTDNITTESGPRLEVADVYGGGRVLARSPGMVGTSEWAPEEGEFASGPETRLVRGGPTRLPRRAGWARGGGPGRRSSSRAGPRPAWCAWGSRGCPAAGWAARFAAWSSPANSACNRCGADERSWSGGAL